MPILNGALLIVGALLTGIGLSRARQPWARYRALKDQDANIARYEAWRGGLRDSGQTSASVAMALLRKQARDGAGIATVGVVLAVAGLLIR